MNEIYLPKSNLKISATKAFSTTVVADETSRILRDPNALIEYRNNPVKKLGELGIEISGDTSAVSPEDLKAELAFITRKDQISPASGADASLVMVVATVVTVAY